MDREKPRWDWGIPTFAQGPDSATEVPAMISSAPTPGIWKLGELVGSGSTLLETDNIIKYSLRPDVYLRSIGVPKDFVQTDFTDLLKEQTEPLASVNPISYLRKALERLLGRYKVEVQSSYTKKIFVTYLELHCPKVSGSSVRLEQSAAETTEAGFMVKLFGVGGGEGRDISISVSTSLEGRDGRCYAIQMPVELLVEHCACRRDSVIVSNFVRASVLHAGSGLRQALMTAPECARCNRDVQNLTPGFMEVFEYNLVETRADEIAEVNLKIERGRTSKSVLKFELSPAASSIEFSGEVSTLATIEYKYQLPGGTRYYAFCPTSHPFYYWTSH